MAEFQVSWPIHAEQEPASDATDTVFQEEVGSFISNLLCACFIG